MKKYELINNKWERNSTRKNSKWKLSWTTAKQVDDAEVKKSIEEFNSMPFEKYIEDYEGLGGAVGKKYTVISGAGLIRYEVIIIPSI